MILFRGRLNRLRFGIQNKVLNFHDWTLFYHELFQNSRKKQKSIDLAMDLWHSNNMKVILCNFAKDHCFWTFWTPNYVDCIPFSCIDSFYIAHNQAKWFILEFPKNRIKLPSLKKKFHKVSPFCLPICLSAHSSETQFSLDLPHGFS